MGRIATRRLLAVLAWIAVVSGASAQTILVAPYVRPGDGRRLSGADVEAQTELVAVLSRRLAERGRERVAATVAQARCEFAAGQCQPMTAAEMVREAQS